MTAPTSIRIAHFSDLHYGPKNLTEADRCFGDAIVQAIRLNSQAAVISGDPTDHALDLHAPAAAKLATHVRRLADHCPVVMAACSLQRRRRSCWGTSVRWSRPSHYCVRWAVCIAQ